MKNKLKKLTVLSVLILVITLSFPLLSIADGPGDPGEGDPGVPFDGGVSILIAAGAAYGVKKYKERKGKSGESESQ